ncbi:MAG TPA: ATP-binding protein [Steroidobacteraceae bacterium]|jgi:HPt (histidine-containing phosphotransfer) domain-containing protein/PAS domain-containing protein|nr:ATP-binding protein [Steroidobacteraceae bacterium]
MNLAGTERRRHLLTASIGTALTLVMGLALIWGFRLATHMRTNIIALQTASTLQTYPEEISHQLNALRDRLEVRAYSGQALADLQASVKRFDQELRLLGGAVDADSPQLGHALLLWHQYGPVLEPVVSFNGQPYVDSDTAGSSLSREGREHYAAVKRAQLFASENARPLQTQLANLATSLERTSSAAATRLRSLLMGGVFAALVLAVVAAYFQLARARHERAAREAQEQTRDILKTVREGFFLLDAHYRIGAVWSEALTRMFSRNDFAGLTFEELLADLVPQSTLATATKYIKLLWGDRAHENLMKSINPLGQLEITMDNGHGGKETRYLQFDFHRVMGPEGIKHVLCSVGDITSSVLLARELHESQENANAQLDMMVGMMHVDPLQLVSFLDTAETGLKLVNTILKEPARTDAEFRKKLAGLFRELHTLKGEASALNLKSIATRVHTLEDMVGECKKKPELSGNDFLPMVLKLDELLAHLRNVREMAARLTALKDTVPGTAAAAAVPAPTYAPPPTAAPTPAAALAAPAASSGSGAGARAPAPAPAGRAASPERGSRRVEELSPALHSMAERLAQDHAKRFRLTLNGLAEVPAPYAATIKDCLIQMLRNAAVHGIEAPEVRRAQAKRDTGSVVVDFRRTAEGYELLFEDDGAGIAPDALKAAAVRRQLITEEDAELMDARAAMALIFRPGFSTQEDVSMDAGRGVGMDVVARSVYALGGKIGVSTHPGKFTRFKIVLPASDSVSTAVA